MVSCHASIPWKGLGNQQQQQQQQSFGTPSTSVIFKLYFREPQFKQVFKSASICDPVYMRNISKQSWKIFFFGDFVFYNYRQPPEIHR